MALTEIVYGSLASSETMNHNFNYLDNRISELSEDIVSNVASTNSNLATMNGSISNLGTALNNSISTLRTNTNTSLNTITHNFVSSGLYVTTYVSGKSWYRAYYSNSSKTSRVWLEQGGFVSAQANAQSTVTLLQNHANANYSISITPIYESSAASRNASPHTVAINSFEVYSERSFYWSTAGK